MDQWLPDVKEEVCGRKAGVFIKGNMRDLYSDGNVLNLACISVKILVLILYYNYSKSYYGEKLHAVYIGTVSITLQISLYL